MQRVSRYIMGRVAACVLSIVLAISYTSFDVHAENEDKVEVFNISINTNGPAWIEYSCEQIVCHGMELIVNNSGLISTFSDIHRVEWNGFIDNNISWRLLTNQGIDRELIHFDSIISNSTMYEENDLPDIVPSPSQEDNFIEINTYSPCQMDNCENINLESEGITFTGALDSLNDKDSIKIVGNSGDIVLIPEFKSSKEMEIEIWKRNNEIKERIESLSLNQDDEYYFEYPKGELWLRIISSVELEYSPYQFEIVRYDANRESPDFKELSNPWIHGDALLFNGTYKGHIAASDLEGDALLIELGSKMIVKTICYFSEIISLDIVLHNIDGTEENYSYEIESCPEIIYSTKTTTSIEFRIKSNYTLSWSIKIFAEEYGDGVNIGDAPDYIWQNGLRDNRWELLDDNISVYYGNLGFEDYVDIFAFEVNYTNGSYIYFNDTQGEVDFKILILNQTNGAIINSTNGTTIIAPKGIHVIRIEKVGGNSESVNYRFSMPELINYENKDGELEDLSRMFTNFYILVGVMFLAPMGVVLWWNRDNIFRGKKNEIHIEQHELMMLNRLKNRIEKKIDKEIIISSLHQLGDSPWDSVILEWGKPFLKHMTENLEICLWKITNYEILLGIKINKYAWNLAGIRIYSSQGDSIKIKNVTPEKIFKEDEIFLDQLNSKTNLFLKITFRNKPSDINFQLSGVVNGEPVAASSNKTIKWEE